ncbi:phosphate acetyltransferase [Amylibacter marinus]|uniref:Phosphate acetyltransferase n=1 Tax=Amylibacter marinus TaxID=1475483 RepID=A0ABQ5VTK5_9RHOB|nr:phosphate acyltransferase [Amylibacter marinus]GLQ34484.1 phosphate acetyltransferase [Amylibacter marinus]
MSGTSDYLSKTTTPCPASLLDLARAGNTPRVAIARAGAPLPMQAAQEGVNAGIMRPIFVGEQADILSEAKTLNWDISEFEIIDTNGEAEAAKTAAELCGAGDADVLMKGQLHTDVFMKNALSRDAGLRLGARFVHLFALYSGGAETPVVVSDAAVNVSPDLDTRKDATRAVVRLLHAHGIRTPKVAYLSATESPIPSVPNSIEARELRDWATAQVPNAQFSGPLALDLIFSEKSRDIKGLQDDPVAGNADAIIVPDITSGNTLFKSMVYLGGACAAGLVVGGKVPMLLTSRADSADARLASVALASVWSNISDQE